MIRNRLTGNETEAEIREHNKEMLRERLEHSMLCPKCNIAMDYVYGERFLCSDCGYSALSDFGKVKEFIEEYGPQPAVDISEGTGVSLDYINELLRQGRIEIPEGSDVYIHCQKCGADIRYGRYCPECMMKLTHSIEGVITSMVEVGEKPKTRGSGMHYKQRGGENDIHF